MRKPLTVAFILAGLSGAALAHHGWGSYDSSKVFTIKSPVEALDWHNPHVTITVKHEGQSWQATLAPISRMQRRGLSEPMLAPGKDVAVGVRSEDMEDGTLSSAPAERRIKGKAVLTEALGSQVIVHFTFPGRPVVTEDTKLMAKESGEAEQISLAPDSGVKWVASFAPRSKVKMGDDIEIAVDIERAHFFDPATSNAIWG